MLGDAHGRDKQGEAKSDLSRPLPLRIDLPPKAGGLGCPVNRVALVRL